jgi:Ni,Fe-hydrogenase III component G
VEADKLRETVEALKARGGYRYLSNITAVELDDRLEVIYFFDVGGKLTPLRVEVSKAERLLPTLADLVPGSLLYEREVRELFGIEFAGHPEPQHLLLPDDWPEGLYPMLKDVSVEEVERRLGGR